MASSAALRELQRDLETQANALSKFQKDIAKNHQVRKQYTIQLGENELVLKELELLNENANVYKLIGPVLVKQDLAEANANVRKRIEYISAELKRLDGTLQDLEDKQNNKKDSYLHDFKITTEDSNSSGWKSEVLAYCCMFRSASAVGKLSGQMSVDEHLSLSISPLLLICDPVLRTIHSPSTFPVGEVVRCQKRPYMTMCCILVLYYSYGGYGAY
ncbi:uncharacterized protein LOC120111934 isoform X2 [Phoenix dactylifera]|uniref:Uncharacterized protein LOC120111934 isoform X2 n=1 Tax=Phoenix dactylifera TaxID=42345 RepID=A0A8B9AIW3_PHODC|nr:uncharacterized protein LOC120111934 isoform X2 [Phoenix dactylifera]